MMTVVTSVSAVGSDFFQSLLRLPYASISYTAQKLLAENTGRNVIHCSDSFFDVHQFAEAGYCQLMLSNHIFSQIKHTWDPMHTGSRDGCYYSWRCRSSIPDVEKEYVEEWEKLTEEAKFAWYDVSWPSTEAEGPLSLELVILTIPKEDGCPEQLMFLLSDSYEIGSKFVITVQQYVSQLQNRIWVFEDGHWTASTELYKAVSSVTFDNLVLTAEKGAAVKADIELFFRSQKLYEDFGLPWKRGYLLTGPPGNGKTHLVKALINHITSQHPNVAPLYVKSFISPYGTDHSSIAKVFKRARQRPCILVLEDLDTLVTNKNRSVFLNELDGFHSNDGVVVIATTNHPDKLDPALRDRPSRFDRSYQFDLPDSAERCLYLDFWTKTAKHPMLRFTTLDTAHLSSDKVTGGFSYAYLKELLLASAMQIVQQHFAGVGDATITANSGQEGVHDAKVGKPNMSIPNGSHKQAGALGTTTDHGVDEIQAERAATVQNGSCNGGNGWIEGTIANSANGSVEGSEAARGPDVPAGLSAFGQIVWDQAVKLSKYIREREEEAAKAKQEKKNASGADDEEEMDEE